MKKISFLFILFISTGIKAQTIFYSQATGNAEKVATWGTNPDGSGANPANFTTAGQEFHITPGSSLTSTAAANWTVSGAGSKVVIDSGALLTKPNDAGVYNFTLDIAKYGKIIIGGTAAGTNAITPGVFDSLSTVKYIGTTPGIFKPAWTYGNLILNFTTTSNFNTGVVGLKIKNDMIMQSTGLLVLHNNSTVSVPPNPANVIHTIKGNFIITSNAVAGSSFANDQGGSTTINVGGNMILSGKGNFTGVNPAAPTNSPVTLNCKNLLIKDTTAFRGTQSPVSFTLNVEDSIRVSSMGYFNGSDSTSTASPVIKCKQIDVSGKGVFYLSNTTGNTICNVYGSVRVNGSTAVLQAYSGKTRTDFKGGFIFKNPSSGYASGTFSKTAGTSDGSSGQLNVTIENRRIITLNSNIHLGTNCKMVNNGTLITKTYSILPAASTSVNDTFINASGATLDIGSPDGITTGGAQGTAKGSVQTFVRSFNAAGIYKYSGTTAQVTGNALPATVKGLFASGQGSVKITQKVTVTDSLGFSNRGKLIAGVATTDTLVLDTNAKVYQAGMNNFVVGRITKKFPKKNLESFTFPLGSVKPDTTYDPFTISPKAVNLTFAAKYVYKNPTNDTYNIANKDASIGSVSDKYYYYIERISTTGNADFLFPYKYNSYGISNSSGLTVVRWNTPTASKWNDLTATVVEADSSLSVSNLSTFGPITLAGLKNSGNFNELGSAVSNFYADKNNICVGNTVMFVAQPSGGSPYTYNWTFQGGNPAASTDANPIVTYPASGNFDVKLSVTNSLGTDDSTKTSFIHVFPKPEAAFIIADTICQDSIALLTFNGSADDAAVFNWDFGMFTTVVSGTGKGPYQLKWVTPGTKSISLSISQYDCVSDLVEHNVVVNNCATGIEQFNLSNHIRFFPNPSEGKLNILFKEINPQYLHIYSLLGEEIMKIAHPVSGVLHLDQMNSGLYLLKIVTDKGLYTEKLILK